MKQIISRIAHVADDSYTNCGKSQTLTVTVSIAIQAKLRNLYNNPTNYVNLHSQSNHSSMELP